jgi:hypothetical protein
MRQDLTRLPTLMIEIAKETVRGWRLKVAYSVGFLCIINIYAFSQSKNNIIPSLVVTACGWLMISVIKVHLRFFS